MSSLRFGAHHPNATLISRRTLIARWPALALVVLVTSGCGATGAQQLAVPLPIAPNWTVSLGTDALHTDSLVRETRLEGLVLDVDRDGDAFVIIVGLKTGRQLPLRIGVGSLPGPDPITSGERISVLYRELSAPTAQDRRAGVMVTDGRGALRIIFADGGLFEPELVSKALRVTAGTRAIYTVARRLDGVCYAVTEHRALVLPDGRQLVAGRAGAHVETDSGRYYVRAVDNAVVIRTDCTMKQRDRQTWLGVWAPQDDSR
ncbi:MAG: hypothetical protein ACI9OJ_006064 [Myxococcota bacterium]|jgi:hypothetical protein